MAEHEQTITVFCYLFFSFFHFLTVISKCMYGLRHRLFVSFYGSVSFLIPPTHWRSYTKIWYWTLVVSTLRIERESARGYSRLLSLACRLFTWESEIYANWNSTRQWKDAQMTLRLGLNLITGVACEGSNSYVFVMFQRVG